MNDGGYPVGVNPEPKSPDRPADADGGGSSPPLRWWQFRERDRARIRQISAERAVAARAAIQARQELHRKCMDVAKLHVERLTAIGFTFTKSVSIAPDGTIWHWGTFANHVYEIKVNPSGALEYVKRV